MHSEVNINDINELVRCFELGVMPASIFHHQEHVKIAWWYLQHNSLIESIAKFSRGLKNFAQSLGKENLYHETITWAFILLINERLQKGDKLANWEEFAKLNGDLLDWQNNVLSEYYKETTLKSELARQVFLLPDKSLPQV